MELKLAYYNVAVQSVSHCATEIPRIKNEYLIPYNCVEMIYIKYKYKYVQIICVRLEYLILYDMRVLKKPRKISNGTIAQNMEISTHNVRDYLTSRREISLEDLTCR